MVVGLRTQAFSLTLLTGGRFLWSSPCVLLFIVSLRCHHFHHRHDSQRRSRFSLSGNASLPLSPPSFAPLCLLGRLAKSWGIVCRCAWREASPSALGEHVVWECLCWHSFKLSPTQHAGVCLSWMTMLNPPPHEGGILRLRWHQQSCWFGELTNRIGRNVNKKQTNLVTSTSPFSRELEKEHCWNTWNYSLAAKKHLKLLQLFSQLLHF